MNAPFEIDFGGLELSLGHCVRVSAHVGNLGTLAGYAPCHIVLLPRVPDGTRVGVEHGRDVHISLLAGRSGGGGGHADSAEEEGSEGLREHHLVIGRERGVRCDGG